MIFRLLLLLCLLGPSLRAADLRRLRDSGADASCINVVFLAEGYTAAEKETFFADAQAKGKVLVGNEAFVAFESRINIQAIHVDSLQSGVTTPRLGLVRDTYFQTSFGVSGIDRLLAINGTEGTSRLLQLLATYVPSYDIVVILVNSKEYGGSGGSYACVSMNSSSDEVLLHELGHSFAHLSDEYIDPQVAGGGYASPNSTNKTKLSEIPWASFILPGTTLPSPDEGSAYQVGLYEGAVYLEKGWFRPTQQSKMRSLGQAFGPVNTQAFADAAYRTLGQGMQTLSVYGNPAPKTGERMALYAIATGLESAGFQWRKDGSELADTATRTLAISPVGRSLAGMYSVQARADSRRLDSQEFQVGSGDPLRISIIPYPILVRPGETASLSVAGASGTGLQYQWYKDNKPITGATGSSLFLPAVGAADLAYYAVSVSGSQGDGYAVGRLYLDQAPYLLKQPASTQVQPAAPLLLSVDCSSWEPVSYQWYKDGQALPGRNGPEFSLGSFTQADAGSYWVVVTSRKGSTRSATAVVELETNPLTNLSVRGLSSSLVIGFVGSGGSRDFLVRAAGPSLKPFHVSDVLEDPRIELHRNAGGLDLIDARNDTWSETGAAALNDLFSRVGAFSFSPGSVDAAFRVQVDGPRSVVVGGPTARDAGVVLMEVYDVAGSGPGRLTNLSARGFAGQGSETLAAGFVVSGTKPRRFLVRAAGPALADFGVPEVLSDPTLQLYRVENGVMTLQQSNDDWASGGEAAMRQAFNESGAFAFKGSSGRDSALVVTLPPGVYSAQVAGKQGAVGTVLVEIYLLP